MRTTLLSLVAALALGVHAQTAAPQLPASVVWHELGTDENSSMPLGNGDVAVNAWTEPGGDLVMLLAKSDAWSENALLYKVGRVRVRMEPNPFVGRTDFKQQLVVAQARLLLTAGADTLSLWVDACNPVVHADVSTAQPVALTVTNEPWRTRSYHMTHEQLDRSVFNYWEWRSIPQGIDFLPDTVLPRDAERIAWCHFNSHSMYPTVLEREHLGSLLERYPDPLLYRCFGAVAEGSGMLSTDDRTLRTVSPQTHTQVSIGLLTEQTESAASWHADIKALMPAWMQRSSWAAHQQWWQQFWQRSWISVEGSDEARQVSQGYAMNRYMTAICSRGEYPVKFNGSLLTVGHDVITPDGDPAEQMAAQTLEHHDPDYRDWGSCFWNQNIRHTYYPLVAQGDYDLLMPWLNLYTRALPLATDRTRLYYGHGGASFIETMHFFGLPNLMDFGWDNPGCDPQSPYMRWHTQGALEVITTMLDYYDHTQDVGYLNQQLLPFAQAILTYYAEHWPRGADGKIQFQPHQSIEMYQTDCANPTPDIAGLLSVCQRLLSLECGTLHSTLSDLLHSLPPIPVGTTQDGKLPLRPNAGDRDGLPVILPAHRYGDPSNGENPELYCVFPYRIYCLGKPQLQLALNTYAARRYPFNQCWGQDGMEAALLGITPDAQAAAVAAFTCYGTQKFPWFWRKVADYSPDMDNGGTGAMTLQLMLMQCQGREIRLLPAWPQEWSASFRLHAPFNTTVEGRVEQGRVVDLTVTPQYRLQDVVLP